MFKRVFIVSYYPPVPDSSVRKSWLRAVALPALSGGDVSRDVLALLSVTVRVSVFARLVT